jgi:hypothetical protein
MGRGSTRIARINLFTSWQAQEWHGFDTGDGSGEGCFDVADPSTGLRAGPSTGLRGGGMGEEVVSDKGYCLTSNIRGTAYSFPLHALIGHWL